MRKIDAGRFGFVPPFGIGWGRIAGVSYSVVYLSVKVGSRDWFWSWASGGTKNHAGGSRVAPGRPDTRLSFAVRDCLW